MWKGAHGVCLKIPTAPGNTSKIPQCIPLNNPRETLTGILVEINSDACYISFVENWLDIEENFFYPFCTKKELLITFHIPITFLSHSYHLLITFLSISTTLTSTKVATKDSEPISGVEKWQVFLLGIETGDISFAVIKNICAVCRVAHGWGHSFLFFVLIRFIGFLKASRWRRGHEEPGRRKLCRNNGAGRLVGSSCSKSFWTAFFRSLCPWKQGA